MNDPKRLIEEGSTPHFERGLLESATNDEGSSMALERTLRKLRLGGAAAVGAAITSTAASAAARSGAAGVATSTAASAGAATGVVATSAAATSVAGASAGSTVAVSLGLKWIILGAVASGFAVGALLPIRSDAPPSTTQVAAPVETEARTSSDGVRVTGPGAPSAPAAAEEAPQIAAMASASPTRVTPEPKRVTAAVESSGEPVSAVAPLATAVVPHAPAPLLTAELALLERARAALAVHDGRRALGILDEYAGSFSHGVLSQEASVLRIEALLAVGDRAGAEVLARPLLAGSSPHASRIRALFDSRSASPNP